MPRPMQFPEQIQVALPPGTFARIDAAAPNRGAFGREAILRALDEAEARHEPNPNKDTKP